MDMSFKLDIDQAVELDLGFSSHYDRRVTPWLVAEISADLAGELNRRTMPDQGGFTSC